jgi:hypothetical protein
LGAEVEEPPLFLPTPFFMVSAGERDDFFCLSFVISLVFYIFSGKAWAEGKGELATCRHRADSGRELGKMYAAIVYIG